MNVKKTNDKKSNPMRHSHTARLKAFFETFFSRKLVVIGFIIIMMIIVIAIFAPLLTQYDPLKSSLKEVLRKPSLLHPFGTDDLGRDILTRIFYGARVSLVVGIASTLVAGVVGMIVGLIAGYAGGVAYRSGADIPRGVYKAGQMVKVEINFWDIGWCFKTGTRLRLDISSSDFPQYSIHSNYPGVWSVQTKTKPAVQTVYSCPGNTSTIIFPIISNK